MLFNELLSAHEAMTRIALFGGSFNPPHIGHQMACLYVLETSSCKELWMVPTFRHPFDKALAPFEDRFEMCRRAAVRIGGCSVSLVQAEVGGQARAIQPVAPLRAEHPGHSF